MVEHAIGERGWKDWIEIVSASREWITLKAVLLHITADRLARFMSELRSDRCRRGNLIVQQYLFGSDAFPVYVAHVFIVRFDLHALKFDPGEQTPAARIRVDLRVNPEIG